MGHTAAVDVVQGTCERLNDGDRPPGGQHPLLEIDIYSFT